MNHDEQRVLAANLASGEQWTKTRETIQNSQHCFEVIILRAIKERGLDEVVAKLLQGPAEWAFRALSTIPNLSDAHKAALVKKACEEHEWAVQTLHQVPDLGAHRATLTSAVSAANGTTGQISAMSLLNQGGYVCKWSIQWMDSGKKQTSSLWSGNLALGQKSKIVFADFAKQGTGPLTAGDEVWMYVYVHAGDDMQSIHFTYNPGVTPTTADFSCSGTTTSDKLGFNGYSD